MLYVRKSLVGFLVCLSATACDSSVTSPSEGTQPAVMALKAGVYASCALTKVGKLYCWGLWSDPTEADSVPQAVADSLALADFTIADGQFGGAVCATALSAGGYCWGLYAVYYDQYSSYPAGPLQDSIPLSGLTAGDGHVCGLASDGSAYCWGSSLAGKRGEGSPAAVAPNLTVNRVAGDLQFSALAAARYHTCGLTSSGNVYCWGRGDLLGDNLATVTDNDCFFWASCAWAPVPVRALAAVRSFDVDAFQSCAILENGGTVWCWEALAPWDGTNPGLPSLVALPEAAAQVAVGGVFTCALGSSGKVYCWGTAGPWRGTDDMGALVEVKTNLRFRSISAGNYHTCGIDTEGAPYCWGQNNLGQLGDGSHTPSGHPVRIILPQ